MTTIHPHHLSFLEEARANRDKKRSEGAVSYTYRNEEGDLIALFMDDSDDILIYELGPEVAYFSNVTNPNKDVEESK